MQQTMVQFLVGDIIHPSPAQVLCALYEHKHLQGEVIAVTDDGQDLRNLFVVRVNGLNEPVIVPAKKTSRTSTRKTGPETAPCESLKTGRGLIRSDNQPRV
jgi:hypothetical protein